MGMDVWGKVYLLSAAAELNHIRQTLVQEVQQKKPSFIEGTYTLRIALDCKRTKGDDCYCLSMGLHIWPILKVHSDSTSSSPWREIWAYYSTGCGR